MKTKFKIGVGIVALLVLSGIALFVFSFSQSEPVSKSLDDIGISISKNQLADVGYGTPEAALETHTWAMANTNYDKLLESVTPEVRAIGEKNGNGRERFEAGMKRGMPTFEKMHILAKKTIAADKVELKVATEQEQGGNVFAVATIDQMVEVGTEWKTGASRSYDPSWDKGSQAEPAIRR